MTDRMNDVYLFRLLLNLLKDKGIKMKEKMRAGILHKPGLITCELISKPEAGEGEVLVAVKKAGICGSDIPRFLKGVPRYNFKILGHEFVGEVVEVGRGVNSVEVGERVAVNPDLPCGKCPMCRVGEYALCEHFTRMGTRTDGGFAEYIRVPAGNLLKLPTSVDYETGAMLEPAATALHTVKRGGVFPGDIAVVMGCGCIGCLIAQELNILGARQVYVIDIVEAKLKIAAQVGLRNLINVKQVDPVEKILKETGGRGADVVFESAGSVKTVNQSIKLARRLGRIALLGLINEEVTLSADAYSDIIRHELNLRGVFGNDYKPFPSSGWETALDYLATGKLKVKPLITHHYPIEEIDQAFQEMSRYRDRFNKVLIEF